MMQSKKHPKSQSRLRAKRYPAGRGAQRLLALAICALAVFVLFRALGPGEQDRTGQGPGATPLAPVTPTPAATAAPTRTPAPTPFISADPQPGFSSPEMEEERSQSIFIPKLDWHLIQLGAYSTAEAAEQQARLYTGRGAAGYILEDD